MPKPSPRKKAVVPKGAKNPKTASGKKTAPQPRAVAKATTGLASPANLARAKALEVRDAAPASIAKPKAPLRAAATAAHPLRNSNFPHTHIKQISISLNDPDHWMTLSWTGPQAASQETGPFRTSPGAGMKGLNCDNVVTSRRSGTKCTPKGTLTVSGFQQRLNSDSRATFVTWFMRARGIALHYFPSVPNYAASHGCVRIESKRVAQLIQENARINLTKVTVDGTWTKPVKQW